MQQHVGIVGVGHGAGALLAFDAASQILHGLHRARWGDVIVVVAQIAHLLGPDAAAPDIAVGGDVAAGPAGVAGDDLVVLVQDAFGELVIVGAESLGEAGNALGRRLLGLLAEKVGDLVIFVGRGVMPQPTVSSSTRSSATSVM